MIKIAILGATLLCILALTGLVTVREALSGFSNPAVITVGAVLVVSGGLLSTAVAGALRRGILRVAGSSEARIVALLMATGGLLACEGDDVKVVIDKGM